MELESLAQKDSRNKSPAAAYAMLNSLFVSANEKHAVFKNIKYFIGENVKCESFFTKRSSTSVSKICIKKRFSF